jgi:transposase InsO family protein
MIYRFVEAHRQTFPISAMCRVLEVSTSGYYAWRIRPESQRSRSNRVLTEQIRAAQQRGRGTYGSPRIYRELLATGTVCGLNRVARLMRKAGIHARRRRKFRVTTNSRHRLPVAENKLDRAFDVALTNTAWVADLTYIWTQEGWLYLAAVMDLSSRRIVGWSMDSHMKSTLVEHALEMALARQRPGAGLLHHSDRGIQYASAAYQGLLARHGIVCSMSRKGNCWDNAPMESFFGTLKTELVHDRRFPSRAVARRDIFDYIEVFYNRVRRHSALDYVSPAEFELTQLTQLAVL